MIQYFTRLFRYDKWANEQVIKVIKSLDIQDENTELLMSHILNTEEQWWEYITDGKSEMDIDKLRPIPQWLDKSQMIYENYRDFLKSIDEVELDRRRKYVNAENETQNIPLRDVLGHVINHSTYHRAQIAYRLKELSIEPPVTDYIDYLYQI